MIKVDNSNSQERGDVASSSIRPDIENGFSMQHDVDDSPEPRSNKSAVTFDGEVLKRRYLNYIKYNVLQYKRERRVPWHFRIGRIFLSPLQRIQQRKRYHQLKKTAAGDDLIAQLFILEYEEKRDKHNLRSLSPGKRFIFYGMSDYEVDLLLRNMPTFHCSSSTMGDITEHLKEE